MLLRLYAGHVRAFNFSEMLLSVSHFSCELSRDRNLMRKVQCPGTG